MDLENREMQRIQVIGRAIMSHVQQLFRNADLFDANNQIFGKLSTTLSNYVEESFKLFGACTLRINAHQVFLEDNRVFVDAGMIESVNFLTQIFNNGEISGFSFHQECTVPDTLLKSLFAFREALINDKAKGVDAIVKGLTRRHVPYLSPLPQMENPTTMTGIRDLENAKKFCLRNAAKIILFLEEFGLSVEKEELPKMNILYRLIMNLMRIQETYPHLVTGLIHFPIKDPFQDQAFRSIVLLLTVGKTLAMDRRTQIDLCTASIFQKYGYLTIPTVVRNSPRIDEFLRTVSERGAKKFSKPSLLTALCTCVW